VLAAAAYVTTQVKIARTGDNKAIGLTLAEAAVDDSVDQLASNPKLSASQLNANSAGSLYTDANKTTKVGDYTVDALDTLSSWTPSISGSGAGLQRLRTHGTNPNGSQVYVVAYIKQGNLNLGGSAILSNGDVSITGTADIETTNPPPYHVADVFANGNISQGGSSTVDGTLIAVHNISGSGYYANQTGAAPFVFPDSSQISAMQNYYKAYAQSTTSPIIGTTYQANKLFQGGITSKTITVSAKSPAYISGKVQLTAGQTLTFTGDGIVYLDNDLKTVAGSQVINGSTLIVAGQFTQGGQSTYQITTGLPSGTSTPSLAVFGGDITLAGGSTNVQWGIIYAVNGGITVNGNAVFTGALVAGSSSSGVKATVTFTQYFPANMASKVAIPQTTALWKILEK